MTGPISLLGSVLTLSVLVPVRIEAFTSSTCTPSLAKHPKNQIVQSIGPLFVGVVDEVALTEGLQKIVERMDFVMSPEFFEPTASLKALYSNCARTVEVQESSIQGAGLGLFAKKNIKAGTIISFYPSHALGLERGSQSTFCCLSCDEDFFQMNPSAASCYLHCTDQPLFKRPSALEAISTGLKDVPLYLDVNPDRPIVPAWVSQMINDGATVTSNSEQGVLDYYAATKAKKNCIHIPFGPSPIMATVTTKKVKKGEELFTSYGGTYWLGVLLDVHGDEGVGITPQINIEIKETATDLLKSMQAVSTVYANQAEALQAEFDRIGAANA